MKNILTIKNLTKYYNKRKIVNNVSMELPQGEIIGLLGPNGAGKTSCFYMILGLTTCESGSIWLNNKEITFLPVHQRAKLGIGYLPQEPSVFRKLSVKDNILAILQIVNNTTTSYNNEQLEYFLKEFNLIHLKDVLGISLSGGERRRLEIARTLAANPKFILLDEPFAGVDPIAITEIKKILLSLAKKNIGIIITDHNVRETLNICDQAYIMNDGKLIAKGNMEEIINNNEVKEVYLGQEFKV
ncbi:MAG: LPS export ABC transporter ATP-binding protein [Gammaproteobacteria bacterium]|jgi:lipopolysaccharide export system ATP-binding protein